MFYTCDTGDRTRSAFTAGLNSLGQRVAQPRMFLSQSPVAGLFHNRSTLTAGPTSQGQSPSQSILTSSTYIQQRPDLLAPAQLILTRRWSSRRLQMRILSNLKSFAQTLHRLRRSLNPCLPLQLMPQRFCQPTRTRATMRWHKRKLINLLTKEGDFLG